MSDGVMSRDIAECYFTSGACPLLAWEIHKLTGWKFAILSSAEKLHVNGGGIRYLGHVVVLKDDMLIDIHGQKTLKWHHEEWKTYELKYFHKLSKKKFSKEISGWTFPGNLGRNKAAKYWAKKIVEEVNGNGQ